MVYLEKMSLNLSTCSTGHLGRVPAVTISPRTTSWRKLRSQPTWQCSLAYLFLFWILMSSRSLYYITGMYPVAWSDRSGVAMYYGYCTMLLLLLWSLCAVRTIIYQSCSQNNSFWAKLETSMWRQVREGYLKAKIHEDLELLCKKLKTPLLCHVYVVKETSG